MKKERIVFQFLANCVSLYTLPKLYGQTKKLSSQVISKVGLIIKDEKEDRLICCIPQCS